MISECMCLSEAVEMSKDTGKGSFCIVPGMSSKQVENREGTVKTGSDHMFFLCPPFLWLGWLLFFEHKFLVNILIYFFDLFLLSVLDPFIQQTASGISDSSSVSSCILMTEVKPTFLSGRELKVHGLNERSVFQRCVPPSYPYRCHCTYTSFPPGPAVTLCWWSRDLPMLTEKWQPHLKGKSDGKSDCRSFQPMVTSVPPCLGAAAMLR